MLIGISAHCAKLTQDIPGPALPDSTRRTVKLHRMFSSRPQGSGKMHGRENKSQRKMKTRNKRLEEYFFFQKEKEVAKRLGYCVTIPVPRLEKVMMHF